jgi:hypothetical protein
MKISIRLLHRPAKVWLLISVGVTIAYAAALSESDLPMVTSIPAGEGQQTTVSRDSSFIEAGNPVELTLTGATTMTPHFFPSKAQREVYLSNRA